MITSTSNTQIKNVINLIKKSKDRKAQGLFVVEGKRMFEETPKERIHSLFVSESFERANKDSLRGYAYELVADDVFSHMSDTKTPQGGHGTCKDVGVFHRGHAEGWKSSHYDS